MKIRKILKTISILLLSAILAIGILCLAVNIRMISYAKPYIYSNIDDLPEKYTIIVPGAKVYKTNISHVVRDRIDGAANLLVRHKGTKILVSGDHGRKDYDEVNRMREYLMNIYSVNGDIIFMDHAGFSTYETMYRARDIFLVKDAVIVTQKFHAARCVYIARKLGLDAVAYVAPELTPFSRRTHVSWSIRETLARVKNYFLVLKKALPTYLGDEIPITGDSHASWD